MTAAEPLVAREYRRLSDKGGTSIARQGSQNAAAGMEQGWILGKPYTDDGLSASRYARKRRDDFERLVADLKTGPTGRTSAFAADILMLLESSRGSRQVGEWVTFIELCEAKQVLIWVTTHERLYDPRNGRDRKTLLEDAVDSEYESYKTHMRTNGTVAYQASIGRPHGRPPDGLMPVYDTKTGELLDWVEDHARSELYRELFRLLEKGHSLTNITGRFEKAGYLNLSGRPYVHQHLRQSALKHAYAGLRLYKGQVYDGTWSGFIPLERFWNVQRILNSPHRQTNRTGRATHELTASLWCFRCEIPIKKVRKSVTYECKGCGLRLQKKPFDDLIIGFEEENGDGSVTRKPGILLDYLARDDIYELVSVPDGDDEALSDVRARLAQVRVERDDFRNATAANASQALIIGNSLDAKEREVAELEERERELTLPPSVLSILQPGTDVWDTWHEAPVTARRELAKLVLREDLLGRPYIHPAPNRGRNQQIAERIEWRISSGNG
jgi:site-specific DNA recombinase